MGQRRRLPGLLAELAHAAVGERRDDAEGRGLLHRHGDRRHRGVGFLRAVEGEHLAHVHPVDVVGGEHRDDIRRVRLQHIQVLADGIRRAPERNAVGPRQQRLDHALAILEPRRPIRLDVAHERLGLVLGEHIDGGDLGVDQVAQDEVHDAVAVGERQRRLRVLRGQRVQARAFAAGQHDRKRFHGIPFL